MSNRKWIFLSNTFFVQTQESMKNALSLAQDHLAKLTASESDATIATLKANYLPAHNNFVTAYNLLQSKLGLYKGKTQTTEEALEELSQVKINEWRGQVFPIYNEGTANATAIFPQGRRPFQQGTYEQRIEAVAALYNTLATFTTEPALINLGDIVQSYYNNLLAVRALQQNDEGSTNVLRENLRLAHINLCNALYANLGGLMQKYATNTDAIAGFFDLSLLRDTGLEVLTNIEGNIEPNAMLNLGLLPDEGTVIRFENKTDVPLEIGLSENGSTYSGNTTTLGSAGTIEIKIADLNSVGNLILLRNQSNSVTGSYKVQVLG
jgi:hypothetical protein